MIRTILIFGEPFPLMQTQEAKHLWRYESGYYSIILEKFFQTWKGEKESEEYRRWISICDKFQLSRFSSFIWTFRPIPRNSKLRWSCYNPYEWLPNYSDHKTTSITCGTGFYFSSHPISQFTGFFWFFILPNFAAGNCVIKGFLCQQTNTPICHPAGYIHSIPPAQKLPSLSQPYDHW